ncbi:MAG: DUF6468 domain-containing protein [Alphaproteobacteria bacterium]
MNIQTIFDLIVIVLLATTIGFATVLNRKLDVIRKSKKELGSLINDFNIATSRAETSIPKFKQTIEANSLNLKEQIEKAQVLRDDLSFMIERSESIAERLEEDLATARHETVNKQKSPMRAKALNLAAALETKPAARNKGLVHEEAKTMLGAMALGNYDDEEAFFAEHDNMSDAERNLLRAMQSSSLKDKA